MFSYVCCDGIKLMQDVVRLPLECPIVAVIKGLWLVKIIKRSGGGLN